MRRVTINERDVTVVDNQTIVTDVVYVPGFATGTSGKNTQGAIVAPNAAEPRVPTYCANIEEFYNAFGSDAPYFTSDQYYPVFTIPSVPAYDSNSTYSVGDVVVYNGSYYSCITAISEPEAWNSSKWEEISAPSSSDGFTNNALPSTGGDVQTTPVMFKQNQIDPSYVYAVELLLAGLPVVYERINQDSTDITVEAMYSAFTSEDSVFNPVTSALLDKNGISIKYLTSGGYPTYEYTSSGVACAISKNMQQLAYNRGDCIAFVDHTNNPERALTGQTSIYGAPEGISAFLHTDSVGSYSTMITPWVNVSGAGTYSNTNLPSGVSIFADTAAPGSFAYLSALAVSLRTNANWLAIAGVARGRVPHLISLNTDNVMTNTIAENMTPIYGVAINPITNIRPYGESIWGNRTLLDTTSKTGYATGFLNIRNLVCDVKKQAYIAAMSCMFEQNTDVLWINFKSMIQPLLEQMRTGAGLKNYKIIKLPGSDRETIRAKIILVPVYAVEQFIIDIYITDSDIALEEVSTEA